MRSGSFKVNQELIKKIKEVKKVTGVSITAFIEQAITEKLKQAKNKK